MNFELINFDVVIWCVISVQLFFFCIKDVWGTKMLEFFCFCLKCLFNSCVYVLNIEHCNILLLVVPKFFFITTFRWFFVWFIGQFIEIRRISFRFNGRFYWCLELLIENTEPISAFKPIVSFNIKTSIFQTAEPDFNEPEWGYDFCKLFYN